MRAGKFSSQPGVVKLGAVVREKSADSTKRLRESRTARWEVLPQLGVDFGSGWGKPWWV